MLSLSGDVWFLKNVLKAVVASDVKLTTSRRSVLLPKSLPIVGYFSLYNESVRVEVCPSFKMVTGTLLFPAASN